MQYSRIKYLLFMTLCGSISACNNANTSSNDLLLEEKQALGKQVFFDSNLSEPSGQACASCHQPGAGFADPDREIPVSRGVDPTKFGNRNTPSIAYSAFSPAFHFDEDEGIFFGGQFLDGRASTQQNQAKQPFLNPLEMANPDIVTLIEKVSRSSYANDFKAIYGDDIFTHTETAFDSLADAIAAFERSSEVNAFSSKFDLFIAGETTLSAEEQRGLNLFNRVDKGNCAACYPSTSDDASIPPLFTDFSYDNLGTPANPNSPFLTQSADANPAGTGFVDFGLGGELGLNTENGKFKVPSLRNVNLTAPYMHNGVFNTLAEVLDFYSDRDSDGVMPEVAENVNHEELGALNLSAGEKADIIAFLKTLSDGYQP